MELGESSDLLDEGQGLLAMCAACIEHFTYTANLIYRQNNRYTHIFDRSGFFNKLAYYNRYVKLAFAFFKSFAYVLWPIFFVNLIDQGRFFQLTKSGKFILLNDDCSPREFLSPLTFYNSSSSYTINGTDHCIDPVLSGFQVTVEDTDDLCFDLSGENRNPFGSVDDCNLALFAALSIPQTLLTVALYLLTQITRITGEVVTLGNKEEDQAMLRSRDCKDYLNSSLVYIFILMLKVLCESFWFLPLLITQNQIEGPLYQFEHPKPYEIIVLGSTASFGILIISSIIRLFDSNCRLANGLDDRSAGFVMKQFLILFSVCSSIWMLANPIASLVFFIMDLVQNVSGFTFNLSDLAFRWADIKLNDWQWRDIAIGFSLAIGMEVLTLCIDIIAILGIGITSCASRVCRAHQRGGAEVANDRERAGIEIEDDSFVLG